MNWAIKRIFSTLRDLQNYLIKQNFLEEIPEKKPEVSPVDIMLQSSINQA